MGFSGWLTALHADPGNQPPPLTWLRLLTEWKFDPLFAIPAALGLGLYLWGSGGCGPVVMRGRPSARGRGAWGASGRRRSQA